jgi:hypothetical protein
MEVQNRYTEPGGLIAHRGQLRRLYGPGPKGALLSGNPSRRFGFLQNSSLLGLTQEANAFGGSAAREFVKRHWLQVFKASWL